MWHDYLKEREGVEVVENGYGFATYRFVTEGCYLVDLYIKPEHRRGGHASHLGDLVCEVAKARGVTKLIGSVSLSPGVADPTTSIAVLLAYGMRVAGLSGEMLYFEKEII